MERYKPEYLKLTFPDKIDADYAYKMGFSCARNGANTTNCNFSLFNSPENTKAWEKGNSDGQTRSDIAGD